MLVVVINAFLHMQSSPILQSSFNFSHHLHAVITHFASLGPETRLYLLKCRTLARQLQILLRYNNSANVPHTHIDEAQVMFEKVPIFDILRNHDAEGGYLTPNMMQGVEQKISFKERQQILQTMSSPMVFVILTISILSRSCKFVNTN